MEKFKIAQSNLTNPTDAVRSITEQLSGIEACMILYFASPSYAPDVICKEMANVFAGIPTIGCTSAGEMISGKMGHDSVVAMAWSKDTLKYLKVEVLENIKSNTDAVANAFKSFEKSLGTPMQNLDPTKYVGMVIIDGLSGCEEKLNDQLGNLTNVPFVGGSAGDNLLFKNTWMFVDGKAYTNAAILILMEPANGYEILKTQSFTTTNKKLIPTKVDEKQRLVIEFNGKSAAEAYAEALGVSIDELPKKFGNHPVGLVFDENNYFVRSAMKTDGKSVTFYCSVKEGMDLVVLVAGDIVATTSADLNQTIQSCGKINAIVDFNCCLRFLDLKHKNQYGAYSELFAKIPTIGFATYGESYIGHINHTSTMLLLK